MSDSAQRDAYTAAQVAAIHRNLRFLEAVVTSPIGLTTDLKSLREAMPMDAAAEERERSAYLDLTARGQDPRLQGLAAARLTSETIDLLDHVAPSGENPITADWAGRANKVLDRARERMGVDLRRETAQAMAGIYVIVDPEQTNGRPVTEVAEAALAGGATAIQLRDKVGDKRALLETARSIKRMCEGTGSVFIVNDHADVARLADADGLHVGQKDLPVGEARRVLGEQQLVGTSNALLQEALDSEAQLADYVAVGAIFPTSTKENTRPAGLETLKQVKRAVATPVVAIGGINHDNVAQVAEAGADIACVATAVTLADDPESATRRLGELFESGG